ncbi:MAG: hypothetical protein Q4E69_06020 [Bacilli bacterium]|nr:hypothetical protein [Bacilli bacterium]
MKEVNEKKENAKKAFKVTIIVLSLIFLIVSIIIGSIYLTRIHNEETHKDLDNYYVYMQEIRKDKNAHTTLAVFPPLLYEVEAEVLDFQYKKAERVMDNLYFFYIECKYNEKNYQRELERVDKLIARKYLLESNSKYDIYITRNTGYKTYEYALFDKANLKVIYVFNQVYTNKDLKTIKKEYKLF